MVKIRSFEMNDAYRSFLYSKSDIDAKWAFVSLYEAGRDMPRDVMDSVYQILKKQVDSHFESYPRKHWSEEVQDLNVKEIWDKLHRAIKEKVYIDPFDGEEYELKMTQREIFSHFAELLRVDDLRTEDGEIIKPAWEILQGRYKSRVKELRKKLL